MPEHGKCRLCLKHAELLDSHIIPAWAWKRARAENLRNPHPVMLGGGTALQDPRQVSEHLLCRSCEKLMKVGEDYACEVTYQKDYRTAAFVERAGVLLFEHDRVRLVDPGRLDPALLAYFGLSVVWRASVSTVIPDCQLDAEHEEAARLYLLKQASFPEDVTCCVAFHDLPYADRTHVASIFSLPQSVPNEPSWFLLYGLQYRVATGPSAEVWRPLCIVHSPQHWVALAPQEDLLNGLGDWFKRQRPRGALAKHGVR